MNAIFVEPEIYSDADYELLNANGQSYELIRGELKLIIPAGGDHGNVTVALIALVHGHVLRHDLGKGFTSETGFVVEENPRTILAPDYAFIAKERVIYPIPNGFMPIVPDLVLETRSPGDTAREVAVKVELWLEVGAREVWELNPRRQILTVYTPDTQPRALSADDKLESPLLPGLSLALNVILI